MKYRIPIFILLVSLSLFAFSPCSAGPISDIFSDTEETPVPASADDLKEESIHTDASQNDEESSEDPGSHYFFTITPRLPYVVMVDSDAESYYARVMENNQNDSVEPFRTINSADYYRLLMMYSQAIQMYDQVLRADPDNVYARKGKAVAVTELFNPDANNALRVNYSDDDLIDICLDAVENNENDPYAWTTVGVAYYYLGLKNGDGRAKSLRKLALEAFNTSLKIDEKLPETLIWRSFIDDKDPAVDGLKFVVQHHPDIAESYIQLWIITGDPSYVEKAVDVNPNQMYTWMFQGMELDDSGDKAGALKSYLKGVDVYLKSSHSIDYCDIWSLLVISMESQGIKTPENIAAITVDSCSGRRA